MLKRIVCNRGKLSFLEYDWQGLIGKNPHTRECLAGVLDEQGPTHALGRFFTSTCTREKKKVAVTDEYNLLQADSRLVQVNGCFHGGFFMGDVQVEGPVICVGDLWFHWKPTRFEDITVDSLALLDVVLPIPELLVLGCGTTMRSIPEHLMKGLKERFVSVEAVDTKNAAATFNILNQEGRSVVGAFIPLSLP